MKQNFLRGASETFPINFAYDICKSYVSIRGREKKGTTSFIESSNLPTSPLEGRVGEDIRLQEYRKKALGEQEGVVL